ncbi:divisome protein SepX/GlpR [Dietzia sp.]|uniref:divisome protein SepX/GlpR n=1 Tax=Dietzia sp. TaxID=1871616 RepID=UPI002FD98778
MSSSLLIVVLGAVWLFVLAPMAIRARRPIRRTGDGLAQTRTLHAGGGRKLQPRRGRVSAAAEDEPEDVELFGLPSGVGSTDAELVEADSWLARLDEDRARHLAETRSKRLRSAIANRDAVRPARVRTGSEESAPAAEEVAASATAERGAERTAAVESTPAETAAAATPAKSSRFEVTAAFAPSAAEVAAESAAVAAAEREAAAEARRAAELESEKARIEAAAETRAAESTYVVDGEVFEFAEEDEVAEAREDHGPSLRERAEAAHAARLAAREAERPAELDDADYDFVERRRGRGVYDPRADSEAAARRAVRRQRTTIGLLAFVILFAVLAMSVTPHLWSVAALGAVVMAAYLWSLRKQVKAEQRLRARRTERLRRARLGVESRHDVELSVVPQRLRRPGSVVLEVDDEDPVFDHLESAQTVARADRARAGAEAAERSDSRSARSARQPARRAV